MLPGKGLMRQLIGQLTLNRVKLITRWTNSLLWMQRTTFLTVPGHHRFLAVVAIFFIEHV